MTREEIEQSRASLALTKEEFLQATAGRAALATEKAQIAQRESDLQRELQEERVKTQSLLDANRQISLEKTSAESIQQKQQQAFDDTGHKLQAELERNEWELHALRAQQLESQTKLKDTEASLAEALRLNAENMASRSDLDLKRVGQASLQARCR